jgi:TonB family protein
MISELMSGLLKANLAAAVAIVVVLLARRAVRARFGARAAYALWAAPLIAGVAILMPHPARQAPMPPMMAQAVAVADVFDATATLAELAPAKRGPDAAEIAFGLWLVGALTAAGLLAFHQARFLASLGRVSRGSGRLRRAERPGVGPALVGAIRPWIVTPADFEARFGEGERTLILAHEETHLARGDAAANALACALQAACWFNPLAHVAARAMRIDQELACDAAVIERFPERRRAYAELLLKTQIAAQPLPLGCHWPAHAEHPLKERIHMLKSPLPGRPMRAAGLVIASSLIAGLGGLAWAAQPGQEAGPTAGVGPGPAERAEAEREFRDSPPSMRVLCKPRPDRTVSNDCTTITKSSWAALPTKADLMALYPAQARKDGVEARVALLCDVAESGRIGECAVVGVEGVRDGKPADASRYGFDRAALKAVRYFEAQPQAGGPRMYNMGVGFSEKAESALWSPNPPVPREKIVAPPPPGAPVAKPVWVQKPTAADIARVYPAAALKAHDRGYVTLACKFSPNGRLRDCKVVNEREGSGFGAAALRLSELFQARPLSTDGDQIGGGTVLIPIYFEPSQATPASYAPPAVAPARRIDVTYAPGNAPPTAMLIPQPEWVEKPTMADLVAAYPAADKDELGGMAVLDCRFAVDGRLTGCRVSSETPPEDGFGAAALKLAPLFRAKLTTPEGTPVAGAAVRIPFRFQGPHSGPALPLDGPVTVTRPVWTEKPTADDIARLYPAAALKQRLSATVVMNCRVGGDGRLAECGIAHAAMSGDSGPPPTMNMDFGTATLQLAKLFRMQPKAADGTDTAGGLIHIPVRWAPPQKP